MRFEKENQALTKEEFEAATGTHFISSLFIEESLKKKIQHKGKKLEEKGELTLEQVWLGKYFKNEILYPEEPDVSIRWIGPEIGWGVFAERDFRKMEFIAEYSGLLKKRVKADEKNAYCFEYIHTAGKTTPYNIDALLEGGVSRYINHSDKPNLHSALASIDGISHIIFYTKSSFTRGTQLCYDYGPDYWSKRKAPLPL